MCFVLHAFDNQTMYCAGRRKREENQFQESWDPKTFEWRMRDTERWKPKKSEKNVKKWLRSGEGSAGDATKKICSKKWDSAKEM